MTITQIAMKIESDRHANEIAKQREILYRHGRKALSKYLRRVRRGK